MGKRILHIKLTDSQFEELQKKATASNLSLRKYTINTLGLNSEFKRRDNLFCGFLSEVSNESLRLLDLNITGSKFEYHGRK